MIGERSKLSNFKIRQDLVINITFEIAFEWFESISNGKPD